MKPSLSQEMSTMFDMALKLLFCCTKNHLLMLLLSVRACSKTAKQKSVCLEIPFSGILSHMGTSQLTGIANHLTGFRVMSVFAGRYTL